MQNNTDLSGGSDDDSLFCSVCQVQLASVRAYMAHCSSISHCQKQAQKENPVEPSAFKATVEVRRPLVIPAKELDPKMKVATKSTKESLYCSHCEVLLPDTQTYLAHCSSILHSQRRAQVEKSQPVPKSKAAADQTYDCLKQFLPTGKRKKKSGANVWCQLELYSAIAVGVCALCEVPCSGEESYRSHCAGKQHCKKYLVRQNELGFFEFRRQFGNLLYNKNDEQEPPPDIEDDYVIHVYRSGVHNKLNCRACCKKLYSFRAWYDHILSEDHGIQMVDLLETHGGPAFMNMFGDLPGPNPHLFREGIREKYRKRKKVESFDTSVNYDNGGFSGDNARYQHRSDSIKGSRHQYSSHKERAFVTENKPSKMETNFGDEDAFAFIEWNEPKSLSTFTSTKPNTHDTTISGYGAHTTPNSPWCLQYSPSTFGGVRAAAATSATNASSTYAMTTTQNLQRILGITRSITSQSYVPGGVTAADTATSYFPGFNPHSYNQPVPGYWSQVPTAGSHVSPSSWTTSGFRNVR